MEKNRMFLSVFVIAIMVFISSTTISYGGLPTMTTFKLKPDDVKAETCSNCSMSIGLPTTTITEIDFWAWKPQDIAANICFNYSPVNNPASLGCSVLIDGNPAEPFYVLEPDPPAGTQTRCATWYGEIEGYGTTHTVKFLCSASGSFGDGFNIGDYAASVFYDRY